MFLRLGSISNVNCNYVAKPTDASWGYNITLGEATYNSATFYRL